MGWSISLSGPTIAGRATPSCKEELSGVVAAVVVGLAWGVESGGGNGPPEHDINDISRSVPLSQLPFLLIVPLPIYPSHRWAPLCKFSSSARSPILLCHHERRRWQRRGPAARLRSRGRLQGEAYSPFQGPQVPQVNGPSAEIPRRYSCPNPSFTSLQQS